MAEKTYPLSAGWLWAVLAAIFGFFVGPLARWLRARRLLLRTALGTLLALYAYAGAWNADSSRDGPCSPSGPLAERAYPSGERPAAILSDSRALPPRRQCRAYARGRLVAEETYPRPEDWIVVLLAGAFPFFVAGSFRRLRGARDGRRLRLRGQHR